jgi:5'-nucleotidase
LADGVYSHIWDSILVKPEFILLLFVCLQVDEEECPELGRAIQNHFQAIDIRLGKTKRHSKHRQSLVTLSRRYLIMFLLFFVNYDSPFTEVEW